MSMNRVEPFDGEDLTRSAKQFVRDVELLCPDGASDKAIIKRFGLLLKAETTADKWHDRWTKDNPTNNSWNTLQTAFLAEFGTDSKTDFSRREALNILYELIEGLDISKLGTYDRESNQDYHKLFIRKLCRTAQSMGLAEDAAEEVMERLPKVVKEQMEKKQVDTWKELKQGIEKIRSPGLKRAVEEQLEKEKQEARKKSEDEDRVRRLERAIQSAIQSPTAELRQGLRAIPLGRPAPRPYRQGDPSNPFVTPEPPRPNNLFARASRMNVPIPVRFRDFRANIAGLTHHDPTDDGIRAHRAQVQQWKQNNPGVLHPDELRPYPLKPGTAKIGSGECFKCGMSGHRQDQCTGTPLDPEETTWRKVASFIVRKEMQMRQSAAPVPIQYVTPYRNHYTDYPDDYYGSYWYHDEYQQGEPAHSPENL